MGRSMVDKSRDDDLGFLVTQLRELLADKATKKPERLKAIELFAKVLMIRHRIEGGDKEGSFFDK
jgi:hypothetical protein